MTDTNHHVLTGKVDITSNLLVGSSHLFVDTNNNRVGLVTTNPEAGLHVNSNAYVNTDLRVGPAGVNQVVINATAGHVKAGSFEGDGSLLENIPAGADGAAATIGDPTITTGLAGTDASVTNSGTSSAAVFDFVIPRGDAGNDGNDGAAATIGTPTITTGLAGTDASVTNSGTSSAAVFDFVIPRGDAGTNGTNGNDGTNYFELSGSDIYRSSGNVGLGTTSPNNSLHIYKNADERTSGLFIEKANGGTGTAAIFFGVNHSTENPGVAKAAIFYERNSSGGRGDLKFCNDASSDANNVTPETADTRMIIKNNGNMGIGINSPSAKLHVSGGNLKISASGGGGLYDNGYQWLECDNDASWYRLCNTVKNNGIACYNGLAINNNGGLVVGSWNSPNALGVGNGQFYGKLIVGDRVYPAYGAASGDAQLVLGGTHNTGYNNNDKIKLLISGGNNDGGSPYYIYCEDENGYDQMFVKGATNANGSSGMYMYIIGRIGIGRRPPSYRLDVNGDIRVNSYVYTGSDDRMKYNEEDVVNALALISQLKPQKYEKIMEQPISAEGTWIPTDEEWENVKGDYKHGDEFGFIAQDVRNIPELAFLVDGDETGTSTKTLKHNHYINLTTEEQSTYTISYIHESNTITQVEYSNLTVEEQATCFYTKQIESQTLLSLNYQGLFVVAIGAIQELKAKVETLETDLQTTKEELQTTKEELQSEKNKVATMELLVASLVKRVGDLENLVI
jgi:hypothetical protein